MNSERCLRLLSIVVLLVAAPAGAALASEPEPMHWMEVLNPYEMERISSGDTRGSTRLGDALFDLTDDLTLFNVSLWDSGSFARLRSQRKVFDNQDVLNSWTVVDRIRLDSGLPIAGVPIAGTPLSLRLGTRHAVDFVSIRQVLPKDYSVIPSPDQQERDLQDAARFGRLFDRIAFPVRLDRMEPGEVMAYGTEGTIELGLGVGWNLEGDLLGSAGAGIRVGTYVNGVFRIAVLRESERFARVKVTRLGGIGKNLVFGAKLDPRLVSGLLVFKPASVVDQVFKVTPFEFAMQSGRTTSFDVGYRYDLSDPRAREAYEQALVGRFALSEEVPGVERLFTRDGQGRSTELRARLTLGIFLDRSSQGSHQSLETTIRQPDGTIHLFQSWAENTLEWSLFWVNYEKLRHRFIVHYNPDSESTVQLWAEAEIQDSRTSPSELQAYILEVEDAVGIPWIFPRVPVRGGDRSSFFFRMAFSVDQIEAFASTSPEQAWSSLEKAFGMPAGAWGSKWKRFWDRLRGDVLGLLTFPLYVVDMPLRSSSRLERAQRIHSRWMAIREARNARDAATRMARLFDDRKFGAELVKLLRIVLDQQKVAFQVTGFSPAFGRIAREGNSAIFEQDVATRAQREVDFDREGGRIPELDRLSRVDDLGVRQQGPGLVRVEFSLRTSPRALFIELLEEAGWFTRPKRVGSLIFENAGQFIAGKNLISLDADDPDSPYLRLAKGLRPGVSYRLRIAVNPEGLRWGAVATEEFRTADPTP